MSTKKNKNQMRNAAYISFSSQLASVLRMLMKPKEASIQDRFILLQVPCMTDKLKTEREPSDAPN